MARYDLPKYESVYRDPQSVAINTVLRQRYVENFSGSDALQGAVDDMTSADFEGDKLEKENLVTQYNAELDEMSRQGDYERMGMRVASNARSFLQDYKPIEKNKAKYDAYIAELDRMRKLGTDGGISEYVYKRKIAQAKHGYYGLQRNEEGEIDEGSYFSGPGVVKSVDYIKVLDDALTGIKPSAASEMFDIPQHMLVVDPKDGTVMLQQFPEGGVMAYKVQTTEGWKGVSAGRVGRLVDDILSDPSVQMSLEQDADLQTFDLSPEDSAAYIDEEFARLDKDILDVTNGEGQYEGLSEKRLEELLKSKTEYRDLVLEKREEEGDLSTARNIAKSKIIDRAIDGSMAKHVYSETEYKKLLSTDDIFKHKSKKNIDEYVPIVSTYVAHPPIDQLGGKSAKSKLEFIDNTQASIDQDINDLFNKGVPEEINGEETGFTILTNGDRVDKQMILDEILSATSEEDFKKLAEKYDYAEEDVAQFKKEANQIIRNTAHKRLVQQKILHEQDELLGTDYNDKISKEYTDNKKVSGNLDLNGEDVKNALVAAGLLDSTASVKDAMDYMLHTSGGIGAIKLSSGASGGLLFGFGSDTDKIMQVLLNDKTDGTVAYNPEAVFTRDVKEQGTLNYLMADLLKDYTDRVKKDLKQLNEKFEVEVKTDGMKMNWFGDKENTAKVQETMRTVFDKMIQPDFVVLHPETHEEIQMHEYTDKFLGGSTEYEIDTKNIGMMNVPRADGQLMMIVPITMENGDQVNIMMPTSNLKSPEIDDWTNSAEYQVQHIFNMGRWANVPTYEPHEYFEGVRFDYTDPANEKVFIVMDHDQDPSTPDKEMEFSKEVGINKLAITYANSGFAKMFAQGKRERLAKQ